MIVTAKPVPKEAFLFKNGEQLTELAQDVIDGRIRYTEDGTVLIKTLEGNMEASDGDYIIRGVNGELYPIKPGIFKKTYDVLESTNLQPYAFYSDLTWWLLVYQQREQKMWQYSHHRGCWFKSICKPDHSQVKNNPATGEMRKYLIDIWISRRQEDIEEHFYTEMQLEKARKHREAQNTAITNLVNLLDLKQ